MAQLTRLLRELVELTGEEAGPVPMLELQFGDILTRTTVQASDGNYLVITAMLPQCGEEGYVAQASEVGSTLAAQGMEYLWHADEGRHIGVRRVPLTELTDERGVMDAILTTSDQAAAWFSTRCGGKPPA
ncbi:hypothetical protein [Pseudoduganella namucuonensis]|uniref:hypothetical protein n=1 Tax=Pseudoduganella namucuonensis TaxID=1035707 RepID=UPI0011608574|nr:hypothetical protein [Pseudoduganella namucuonensis]